MSEKTVKREVITLNRETKETTIELALNINGQQTVSIDTGLPFFDHMLNSSPLTQVGI